MVINLQFFGGRGASSGISEKGNAYGTQYKILLEYENIKFVTNAGKNYEALMETMTNGRTYVQIGGEEILRIVQMDEREKSHWKWHEKNILLKKPMRKQTERHSWKLFITGIKEM